MKKRRLLFWVFAFAALLLAETGCEKDEKEEVIPTVETPMKLEIVSPKSDTTIHPSTSVDFVLNFTPVELRTKVKTTVYVDENLSYVMGLGYFKYAFSATKYGLGKHKIKFVVENENKKMVSVEKYVTVYKEIVTIVYNDSVYFKEGVVPNYWSLSNARVVSNGYQDNYCLELNDGVSFYIQPSLKDRYFSIVKKGSGTLSLTTDINALPISFKSEDMGDGWFRQSYLISRGTSELKIKLTSGTVLLDNFILKDNGRPMFESFKCDKFSDEDRNAVFSAIVFSVNGTVSKSGLCWSNTSENPTYWDNHMEHLDTLHNYSMKISPFKYGTVAYVRAFAVNDVGVAYSKVIKVGPVSAHPAVLNWSHDLVIKGDSVYFKNAVVIDSFAVPIIERGYVMAQQNEPTINDTKIISKDNGATFGAGLGNLDESTMYYAKAYVINQVGITYSTRKAFYSGRIYYPQTITSPVGRVTRTTAICGGEVTSDGQSNVLKQGIVYGTNSTPTLNDQVVYTSTATSSIMTKLTGLQGNTHYYYRTFVTNKKYTGYGAVVDFYTGSYDLGDHTEGGYIVYLDEPGKHGLIMADQDLNESFIWSNDSINFMGTVSNPSGLANTEMIVSKTPGENNAAQACYNLYLNGYDDWFLPSFEEFRMSLDAVKQTGLTTGVYWLSTERTVNKALSINIQAATVKLELKSKKRLVRAFRTF